MTIWNVSPLYTKDDTVTYTVLPYDLAGTIRNYFKYNKPYKLIGFLKNSRLTEKSAQKYADTKMKHMKQH